MKLWAFLFKHICEEDENKLDYIPPENIRWDKSAKKKIKDLSFIAYKQCLVPNVVKEKYCKMTEHNEEFMWLRFNNDTERRRC